MTMTPRKSKLVLTSHVTFSVGWLGAVAVFLALAITGLITLDKQLARSTYHAMELSTWFVIIPFCLASFLTGLIQALGTKWGLFRHYWIIVKLFLTFAMTILLFLHLQPISYLAGVATDMTVLKVSESGLVIDLITKAGAAVLALLATTTISIYKPWGKIPNRQHRYNQQENMQNKKKSASFYLFVGLISLIIIFIVIHLFGGGMNGH
jgi:hypothetical protein